MDPRGYSLPIHPGYAAYPRVHSFGPNPKNYYENERVYSLCDLSLSDDQGPEDMPHWTRSSKKHSSSGSRSRGPSGQHREHKKPLATPPKNQNPGIDVALRNLDHEVRASLNMFRAIVQCFDVDIEPLRAWAEDYTLDTVWRNKVKDKVREKRDRERLEGVAGRIIDCRAAAKGAVKNAKALKETWGGDRYKIERQIRTAKKAILYCDGVIDLAERAASERLACKQLVLELEETKCLLDQNKHPWIYGEEGVEKQDEAGYSFDNPPGEPWGNSGDN
ncbi:hypothetical protein C8A00DRAFT_42552 [Chaetomidium leptoderma]|uniref:Uncharacterized protein n=1 Tax=Chaetomidium leptoderma TaxID=669021 RepID=A0AAN6ZZK9_9PEZI|nr:hypothetical protein C8A00DRAFT_42552 [Chaetomidium leptoderma]